jgi:lipopolysaccharide/colanic/teichoic acid biosynthesis glycosyltransferase
VESQLDLQCGVMATGSKPKFHSPPSDAAQLPAARDGYKRPFDLSVLVIAHVVALPLWVVFWTLIPLSIWLTDRGPVFYSQLRMGKNGRPFRVLKFRTMIIDAEGSTGPIWALGNDRRVTPESGGCYGAYGWTKYPKSSTCSRVK